MQKSPNNETLLPPKNDTPPSLNNGSRQWVIIGNPENRRVNGFSETLLRLGHGKPIILSYNDVLSGKANFWSLPDNCIIRIESPGENDTVREQFITRGLPPGQVRGPAKSFGAILHMGAWYIGFRNWLKEIEDHVKLTSRGHVFMNAPGDIAIFFHKTICQSRLSRDIPVPYTLTTIFGYDDLIQQMQSEHIQKVFIKPVHGSSASGVIAFRKMGDKVQAITSTEMVDGPHGLELYNSLTVRTYTREQDIATLIDRITNENVIAEEWLPKATLDDRFFDIRVLVIAKKARHAVLRTSRNVITNLHLGNKRGDMQAFINKFGKQPLDEIKTLAERAAACFPDSLYLGIDILLTPDGKTFVLEVNAFGDLLPGLLDEGETCYEAEINAANYTYL